MSFFKKNMIKYYLGGYYDNNKKMRYSCFEFYIANII